MQAPRDNRRGGDLTLSQQGIGAGTADQLPVTEPIAA